MTEPTNSSDLEEALRRKAEARSNAMSAGFGQNSCPISARRTSPETVIRTMDNVASRLLKSIPEELAD